MTKELIRLRKVYSISFTLDGDNDIKAIVSVASNNDDETDIVLESFNSEKDVNDQSLEIFIRNNWNSFEEIN